MLNEPKTSAGAAAETIIDGPHTFILTDKPIGTVCETLAYDDDQGAWLLVKSTTDPTEITKIREKT